MSAFKCDWVEQYLKRDPKVIIDAGCYNASDTVEFKERWPSARVIGFEACPDNYRQIILKGSAVEGEVEIFHVAVCDHENGVQFNSNTDTNQTGHFGQTGSILPFSQKLIETWPSITVKPPRLVPSVRLDLFCHRNGIEAIDLLHMDVQGAEYFVLLGLGAMRPPMIYLEIDETEETGRYIGAIPEQQIRGWFAKHGYDRVWESKADALYVHERR
jgi:FkbM family methyltransferase